MRNLFAVITALSLLLSPLVASAAAWSASDTFETYSVAGLNGDNGGSGWSGSWSSTNYNVVSSPTWDVSSTRSVSYVGSTNNETASRGLSASVDSGDMYFAIRMNANANSFGIDFLSGGKLGVGTLLGGVQFTDSGGGNAMNAFGASGGGSMGTYSTGSWYIVHVNFVSSTSFKSQVKLLGGSYGSFTANATYLASGSNPDTIEMRNGNNNSNAQFIDDICPQDFTVTTCTGGAAVSANPILGLVKAFWLFKF